MAPFMQRAVQHNMSNQFIIRPSLGYYSALVRMAESGLCWLKARLRFFNQNE